MPWTRHILQSVMIPVVTHSRISGDYQPDNSQWIIGDSTILAHAVGLAPFKDVSTISDNLNYEFTEVGIIFSKSIRIYIHLLLLLLLLLVIILLFFIL